jgi:importin subunit alpha-1
MNVHELQECLANLQSTDESVQHLAAIVVRRAVCDDRMAAVVISQLVSHGALPQLVALLQTTHRKLQFEVAWVLTNVAAGTSEATQALVHAGAVPPLIELMTSPIENVRDQAIWALGNIVADTVESRDLVLSMDPMPALLACFDDLSRESLVRNAIGMLSNLLRGKPRPPTVIAELALPVLVRFLNCDDVETLSYVCSAVSFISGSDDLTESTQAEFDQRVLPRMIELLQHRSFTVQTPVVNAIGAIVAGNDDDTQKVIQLGAVPLLTALLESPKRSLRKSACWVLSNITAGNQSQVQTVIDAGALPIFVSMLRSAPLEIKREACWAVSNVACTGSRDQVEALMQCDALPALLDTLFFGRANVQVALNGFNAMLSKANLHPEHFAGSDAVQAAILGCLEHKFDVLTIELHDLVGDALMRALFKLQRARMTEICIALQALELPALVTVIILDQTHEGVATTSLHRKWNLVTKVKHFAASAPSVAAPKPD